MGWLFKRANFVLWGGAGFSSVKVGTQVVYAGCVVGFSTWYKSKVSPSEPEVNPGSQA